MTERHALPPQTQAETQPADLCPNPVPHLPPRWWVMPLVIYVATRLLDAAMIVLAAPSRTVDLSTVKAYHTTAPGHMPPTYLDVVTSWDAQWYWEIVRSGYASSALDASGHPAQSDLAFFPLFPELVRVLMNATGAGFPIVATTFSVVVGALAVIVVFGFVSQAIDVRRARICVILLCCFPSAPILQAAYTESLALLLVAASLWLLHRRLYLWCVVPVLLLGLTRNVAPAMLVVLLVHWGLRELATRAAPQPRDADVPRSQLATLALAGSAAVLLWPALAALHTGDLRAYTSTVSAWPGFTGSVLMPPWLVTLARAPALGMVLFITALAVGCAWLLPGRRRWGVELVAWTTAYPLYLLATTPPAFTIVRYLLLAFPLGLVWAPDAPSPRALRAQHVVVAALAVAGLVAQWFWVLKLLVYAGPHGGWGFP